MFAEGNFGSKDQKDSRRGAVRQQDPRAFFHKANPRATAHSPVGVIHDVLEARVAPGRQNKEIKSGDFAKATRPGRAQTSTRPELVLGILGVFFDLTLPADVITNVGKGDEHADILEGLWGGGEGEKEREREDEEA